MHHQLDDASKQADHKDRHQQRDYDPEANAWQSAQFLGHRLAHEVTTPWQGSHKGTSKNSLAKSPRI
jgi:hypothetical protein